MATILGVQQGSVLSPLLFSLYLQDINDFLKDEDGVNISGQHFKAFFYADDLALVSDSIQGLQNLPDSLYITVKSGN